MSSARFLASGFDGGFFPSGGGGTPAYADFPTNTMTPPSGLATVLNSPSGVVTSDAMGMLIRKPMDGVGSNITFVAQQGLSGVFTGTAVLQRMYGSTSTLVKCGVGIRAAGGRILVVELRRNGASFDDVTVTQYSTPSTVNASLLTQPMHSSRPSWWRISTDGFDNHTIQMSVDGYAWNTVYVDVTGYVASPNAFGFTALAQLAVGAYPDVLARCIHFEVTS